MTLRYAFLLAFLSTLSLSTLTAQQPTTPLAWPTAHQPSSHQNGGRYNILFIMSDDHAAQAVGCYGSRINQTPNIDRLAREGMRFDNAFCTNSICSPVRAVNLTGKMSHLNGVLDNLFPFDGSQPTAPKYLQAAGYQTAMIGKWHLKSDPTGFDFWKILIDQGEYYNPDFIDNGKKVQTEGYATTLITDYALQWLQQRDPAKPFFMMLHHKAPHRNWMPDLPYLNLYDSITIPEPFTLFDDYQSRSAAASTQEMSIERDMDLNYDLKVWQETKPGTEPWMAGWMDRQFAKMTPAQRAAFQEAYRTENENFLAQNLSGKALVRWKYQRYIKDYLRCIASVDDNVGRVLDYLKAAGLDDNTIVIYTSDQGFYLGEHGWFDKRFMYEESYRQPLLMRWPGHIPAGTATEALVMNLDFAPTFLDLAGLPIPADMQGVSLLPLLETGATPTGWRDATYYHYFEYPGIHAVKRHYGVRTDRYKLLHFYYDIDAWELYDLEEDPDELRNVYNEQEYAEIRQMLHLKLDSLQQQYGDLPDRYLADLEPGSFQHIAFAAPYTLAYPPEKPQAGNPLTDGQYQNFSIYNAGIRNGYSAFRMHPLEAVIDLGHEHSIRSVAVHCIESPESWIYKPARIRVYSSRNGKRFKEAGVFITPATEAPKPVHEWLRVNVSVKKARYIKVVVESRDLIPHGQPGTGERGWEFVDEISIE